MVHANVRVGGAFAGFAAHGFGAKSREAEEIRPHALDGDERALFLFGSELAFVWCHWWVSIFGQPSSFSRRGVRPSFGEWPRPKGEGTARQMARQSLICTPSCEGVAPSGAPSGVLLSASGRAFRDRPDDGRPPSASSWRAARIGRQAEPRRRPGAWPARHARGRRPAPHEPAQPVRVPHGSGQHRDMIL